MKKQKYKTKNFSSKYLSEGALETLDEWSGQYEDFQKCCFHLVSIFSAFDNSKDIKEHPKRWKGIKTSKDFYYNHLWDLDKLKSVYWLNTFISRMKLETEKNWETIMRDCDSTKEED